MKVYPQTFFVVTLLFALVPRTTAAQDGRNGVQKSTLEGVYTEEQALRGAQVYENICAECHSQDEFMEPLMQSWAGAPISMLFFEITDMMPEDAPGSLEPAQYADVLAYILELNRLPPGQTELEPSDEVLKRIMLELRE